MISKVRLWKSASNSVEEILKIESRWRNYTKIKFDGILLEDTTVDDMAIANDDIIIVELPKEDDWVFESDSQKSTQSTIDSTNDSSPAI